MHLFHHNSPTETCGELHLIMKELRGTDLIDSLVERQHSFSLRPFPPLVRGHSSQDSFKGKDKPFKPPVLLITFDLGLKVSIDSFCIFAIFTLHKVC